jgi:hypothetical protein
MDIREISYLGFLRKFILIFRFQLRDEKKDNVISLVYFYDNKLQILLFVKRQMRFSVNPC